MEQVTASADLVGKAQQRSSRDDLRELLVDRCASRARLSLDQLMSSPGPVEVGQDYVGSIVDLSYGGINDTYIGVDSHLPSHFRQLYPRLLDRLATDKGDDFEVRDCYRRRMVRVLPQELDTLQDDLHTSASRSTVEDYFAWHERNGVLLLRVNPPIANDSQADYGLWTTDVGLWIRTCALLFQSQIDDEENVQLELRSPDSYEQFELCPLYIKLLLHHAHRVRYSSDRGVFEEPIDREDREHLQWSLEQIFEPELAQAWRDFVNPRERMRKGEERFLVSVLDSYRGEAQPSEVRVFDASAGIGVESIALRDKGYDVTSNEIDWTLMRHANAYAAEQSGLPLPMRSFDWRHLAAEIEPESYDVILCLGNALACVLDPGEMKKCLQNFHAILKENGILILDERNYRDILARRDQMLDSSFQFKGNVVYCSEDITAKPESIDTKRGPNQRVVLGYYRDGKRLGTFTVYPYAEGEVSELLQDSGFQVEDQACDFGSATNEPAEFVTYTARAS